MPLQLRGNKAIVERQLRNSHRRVCLKTWPTVSRPACTVQPARHHRHRHRDIDAAEVADTYFRPDGPAGHRWPADHAAQLPTDHGIRWRTWRSRRYLRCATVVVFHLAVETRRVASKIASTEHLSASPGGAGTSDTRRDIPCQRPGSGDVVGRRAADPPHDTDKRARNLGVSVGFVTPVKCAGLTRRISTSTTPPWSRSEEAGPVS